MYVPLIPLKYAYLGYIRMANMTLASATFVFVVNIYYIETPGRPKRSRSGGSHGLVVMGGDSCSKGHGFESQHRILDVVKNCNVCLKRQK